MLSRPLLVLTIVEALTDQSESKQEAPGGTASNASSESQSEPQTDSFSIRHQVLDVCVLSTKFSMKLLKVLQNPLKLLNHLTQSFSEYQLDISQAKMMTEVCIIS